MRDGDSRPRVVIVGGGFGGLSAALSLRRAAAHVTLLDRRNFHLFQPLLYQVATGGLSPANIAAPLRSVVRRQKNTRVLMAEVVDIDAAGRRVILDDGEVEYDTLIVATGAINSHFGHDDWAPFARGLKSLEDAVDMRRQILSAFERAERYPEPEVVRKSLTFVVIGGGPTGVELAGALAEIARDCLRHDFRNIDPRAARILLIEGGDRVLGGFPPSLSVKAERALHRLGVEVRLKTMVDAILPDLVKARTATGEESIECGAILWAAGVRASPLGKKIADATGVSLDRAGRVAVSGDLSIPGYPEILVIGDLALFQDDKKQPLAGVAPVAMQQGRYAAKLIVARMRGKTLPRFRFRDPGSMATIGRAAAVVDLGFVRYAGFFAWVTWLFVHLMFLIQFESRVLVMLQWSWNYFTFNRAARLITGGGREVE